MTRRGRTDAVWVLAFALNASAGIVGAQDSPKAMALTGGDPSLVKMSSALLAARREAISGTPPMEAFSHHSARPLGDARPQILIGVTQLSPDFMSALAAAKVDVVTTFSGYGVNTVSVRVGDPRQLDSIARRADVRGLDFEPQAVTHGGGTAPAVGPRKQLGPAGTIAPRQP
ncbi:MAG: hypothetical protein ACR2IE_03200 [Candidatus Sumerlaeaceae bacterium]